MTFVSNVSEDGPAYLAGMRPGSCLNDQLKTFFSLSSVLISSHLISSRLNLVSYRLVSYIPSYHIPPHLILSYPANPIPSHPIPMTHSFTRIGDIIIEIESANVEDDDKDIIVETLRNACLTVRLVFLQTKRKQ